MQARTEYLLDFDGTLTGQPGQSTINSPLYRDLVKEPWMVFGYEGFELKSEDEMLKLMIKEFGPPESQRADHSPQRITPDAMKFLKDMTSPENDGSVGLAIISRNYAAYIRTLLKYEFLCQGLSEQEANQRVNKITVLERAQNKGLVAFDYLSDKFEKYPDKAPQVIRAVDDDETDGKRMEEGANVYAAQHQNVIVTRDLKDQNFSWDNFVNQGHQVKQGPQFVSPPKMKSDFRAVPQAQQKETAPALTLDQQEEKIKEAFQQFTALTKVSEKTKETFVNFMMSNRNRNHDPSKVLENFTFSEESSEKLLEFKRIFDVLLKFDFKKEATIGRMIAAYEDSGGLEGGQLLSFLEKGNVFNKHLSSVIDKKQKEEQVVKGWLTRIENDPALKFDEVSEKHPNKQKAKEHLLGQIATIRANGSNLEEAKQILLQALENFAQAAKKDQFFGKSNTEKAIGNIINHIEGKQEKKGFNLHSLFKNKVEEPRLEKTAGMETKKQINYVKK